MKKRFSNFKDWIRAFLLALLVLLFVKSFFFEIYTLPTTSMEKTLLPGDVLMVNKLTYGPRFPITPLTFPFMRHTDAFGGKPYFSFLQLPYFRFPGPEEIRHNDVIVFNYPVDDDQPVDHRPLYVKRCIALPGEQILMVNKKVFVNQQPFDDTVSTLLFSFNVKTRSDLTPEQLSELDITEGGLLEKRHEYQFTMSRKTAEELRKLPAVSYVKEDMEDVNEWEPHVFPFDSIYPWNRDQSGPLYVPASGDRIQLTTANYSKYERIISDYENNELDTTGGQVLVNGQPAEYYEFKLNYYYVLGDNRDNSSDSRYWGLVPESHILGKASRVVYSIDKSRTFLGRIRWGRLLKPIR